MTQIGWWCPTCGAVMQWRIKDAHMGSSGYDCGTPGDVLRPAYIRSEDAPEDGSR